MKMAWMTSLPILILVVSIEAFNISDPKTNIESLIRIIGSINPDDVDILYGNGTIYGRQPFQKLQKLFFFEGFNIGRKIPTGNGFLSLTREVFVYRDLVTGEIVDIWTNVWTENSNEIFQVHNDPVDMNFTFGVVTVPTVRFPESGVGFTSDIFLQYPNPLDPVHYRQFSAGPLYQADELFQYFSDYDVLATTNISSLNMTGAWFRRAQYLPWMQMGETPGHLYYMSSNWKCLNGIQDFSPDLLELVRKRFPLFLQPPSTFNPVPQTTWGVIKDRIDYRRAHGLPDVIIPTVNISGHVSQRSNSLDSRVQRTFATEHIQVAFNGSVYSEITGKQSVELFKVTGRVTTVARQFGPKIIVLGIKGTGVYRDPKTQEILMTFKNPFTNQTLHVPPVNLDNDVLFQTEDVFSMPVPHLDKITVQGQTSDSKRNIITRREMWSVDMVTIFFKNADLDRSYPYFYGTWARFLSWEDWLDMGDIDGNMVWRMTIDRVIQPQPFSIGKY